MERSKIGNNRDRAAYAEEVFKPLKERFRKIKKNVRGLVEGLSKENIELQRSYQEATVLYQKRMNALKSRGQKLESDNVKYATIIESLLKINNELFKKANFDGLTGLHNRQGFIELMKSYAENGVKEGVLISLDIDKFKSINDTHNHITGNEVLRAVAKILSENFRASDPIARIERKKRSEQPVDTHTVGRIGGEEILIFLPEADLPKALVALRKLRVGAGEDLSEDNFGKYVSIHVPFEFADQELEAKRLSDFGIPENRKNLITFSGSARKISIPHNITEWDKFIDQVVGEGESSLYNAKNSGRDKIYLVEEKDGK